MEISLRLNGPDWGLKGCSRDCHSISYVIMHKERILTLNLPHPSNL